MKTIFQKAICVTSVTFGDDVLTALTKYFKLLVLTLILFTGCSDDDSYTPESEIGSIHDSLGNIYSTLTIRDIRKTWLAGNLNIDLGNTESVCYGDELSNCQVYGRLYSLAGAIEACNLLGSGWRLPALSDWKEIAEYYGGYANSNGSIIGTPSWAYNAMIAGGPSGFDVLLAGRFADDWGQSKYEFEGISGIFWTNTTNQFGNKFSFNFSPPYQGSQGKVGMNGFGVFGNKLSCRCVKDSN